LDALLPVLTILDRGEVPYYVGGSVCSSVLGIPRATIDVDVVADLKSRHVSALVEGLKDGYYVDSEMIHDAISRKASFNLIHLATMVKVDVFVLKSGAFDRSAFERRQSLPLGTGQDYLEIPMASPEDIILHKLIWYRMGEMMSDRQWKDLLGVLKVQTDALDLEYLRHWASILELMELLARAFEDAGYPPA